MPNSFRYRVASAGKRNAVPVSPPFDTLAQAREWARTHGPRLRTRSGTGRAQLVIKAYYAYARLVPVRSWMPVPVSVACETDHSCAAAAAGVSYAP